MTPWAAELEELKNDRKRFLTRLTEYEIQRQDMQKHADELGRLLQDARGLHDWLPAWS